MASSLEPAIKMVKPSPNAPYAQQWYGSYEVAVNSVITNKSYQTHQLHKTVGTLPTPPPQSHASLSDIGKWNVTPTKSTVSLLMSRGGGIVKSVVTVELEKSTLKQAGILDSLKTEICTSVATYMKKHTSAEAELISILRQAINKQLISQCQEKGLSQESLEECKSFAETTTLPGIIKNLRSLMQKPITIVAQSLSTSGGVDPSKNLYGILAKTIEHASVYRVKSVETKYPISCSSNNKITEKVDTGGYTVTGAHKNPATGKPDVGHNCGSGTGHHHSVQQQAASPPGGGMTAFRHWMNQWLGNAITSSPCGNTQIPSRERGHTAQQRFAKQFGLCAKLNEKCLNVVKFHSGEYNNLSECEGEPGKPPPPLFSYQ